MRALGTATVVAIAACGGNGEDCVPTDPGCAPTGVVIASVVVSSPVDSVLALGSTVRMQAEARDAAGRAVAASITWSASDPAVATVSAIGTVNVLSEGSATISAAAGGATGSYGVRAVASDLQAASLVLGDPAVAGALDGLGPTTSSALGATLAQCDAAVVDANVLGIERCLDDAVALTGADGHDQALLGYLELFFEHARTLLELDR